MDNYNKKWLNVIYITCVLIILVTGFALGYMYNNNRNKFCTFSPFVYGIEEMNQLNEADFFCSCSSSELDFYFNEEGFQKAPELKTENLKCHDNVVEELPPNLSEVIEVIE